MHRFFHLLLPLFVVAISVGCGSSEAPKTVDNDDLQAFVAANPELSGDDESMSEGDDFSASE